MNDSEVLIQALRNGYAAQVKSILNDHPDWINADLSGGFPPLVLAAYYNHLDLVDLLLDMGADIDAADASGNSALMGAVFKDYPGVAKRLIGRGADVNACNNNGAHALIYAASFNRVEMAKMLIAHGADIDWKDNTGNTAADHARRQGINPEVFTQPT